MMKQRKGPMTLKLNNGGPSQQQASVTNQRIKALRQGRHWVWGLTHYHAIKEETIAINCDWVYNYACRLLRDIHGCSIPLFYNV